MRCCGPAIAGLVRVNNWVEAGLLASVGPLQVLRGTSHHSEVSAAVTLDVYASLFPDDLEAVADARDRQRTQNLGVSAAN